MNDTFSRSYLLAVDFNREKISGAREQNGISISIQMDRNDGDIVTLNGTSKVKRKRPHSKIKRV